MQFKVPQNVQMEDKIVGPLTLKHLGILGGGGGLAYVIYVVLARNYYWEVWVPPVAIVSILTVLFAFVRIHNNSFSKFLILFTEYLIIPRQRVWNKGSAEIYHVPVAIKKKKNIQGPKKYKSDKKITKSLKQLSEASKIFDEFNESNNNK